MEEQEKTIAVEKFIVTDGKDRYNVMLELRKSGAFQYGNRTMMGMYINDKFHAAYDTRYDSWCNTPEKFLDGAPNFLKAYFDKRFKIRRVHK